MSQTVLQQLETIKQKVHTLVPERDLIKKLEKNVPLKIKLGADPTAPDLHLGHAVVLRKMRQFQDLGHQVIFVIGDFTTKIGDPSGRSKTRPPLTDEQIDHNAKTYFEQVFRILDQTKTQIVKNSQFFQDVNFAEVIKLCAKTTLARLIEREDFATRLANKTAIGFHELLYPILQGYDSVSLQADVELGGTDQTFNLLFGRDLQEQFGQEPQVVLTMPILEGLDGVQKMSKSLGNYIGLNDQPADAFGKLMSISDPLMFKYAYLLLDQTKEEFEALQTRVEHGHLAMMEVKKNLAWQIVGQFWGQDQASSAKDHFESTFQKKDFSLVSEVKVLSELNSPCWIVDLLRAVKAVDSTSDAKRLIESGAVSLDSEKITDFRAQITPTAGQILHVGKKTIVRLG